MNLYFQKNTQGSWYAYNKDIDSVLYSLVCYITSGQVITLYFAITVSQFKELSTALEYLESEIEQHPGIERFDLGKRLKDNPEYYAYFHD